MPLLADNGHSVPLKVTVQSPMTDADHVRGIAILSERNPRPVIARFQLGHSQDVCQRILTGVICH